MNIRPLVSFFPKHLLKYINFKHLTLYELQYKSEILLYKNVHNYILQRRMHINIVITREEFNSHHFS